MSAVILERLLYRRAGIVAPLRSCLPTILRAGKAQYSTESDHTATDRSADDQSTPEGSRSTPVSSSTLTSRLFQDLDQTPMRPYSDSPRTHRGVHRKDTRRKGQTSDEAERLDSALRQIFQDLDRKNFDSPSFGDFSLSNNTDSPAFKGGMNDTTGFRNWSLPLRKRTDREEDDGYAEELDELKEEASTIQTDLELLDWARKRVFVDSTRTDSNELVFASSPIESNTTGALGFSKTYPRILAHIMRMARQAYNNPHLSLAFFDYARTSSPESYLAGCLSSAYNELIKTRWECFRDLDGVDQAIKEMDANAVSWDIKTQLVIGKVVEEVGREVLEKGPDAWGGDRVYEILSRLETRVQKAIHTTEFLEIKARRQREKRLWAGSPADRFSRSNAGRR